jgi:hypothetical protein
MNANFNGRCAVCHQGFPAGTRISYTPPHDGQRSRTVHLECVGRERPPLNDYQRSQIFEQSSPLPPRSRPEDVRAADARERAHYQARREEVEQTGRVPGRDPKRPCRACDDAGYQCEVCGNPGLENAPSNQSEKGTAPGDGRKVERMPETNASRQSTEPTTVGFPRRPARARHIGTPGNRFAEQAPLRTVGHPDIPRYNGQIQPHAWIEGCPQCALEHIGPDHTGSQFCKSGSLASGGLRAHCSCSFCF